MLRLTLVGLCAAGLAGRGASVDQPRNLDNKKVSLVERQSPNGANGDTPAKSPAIPTILVKATPPGNTQSTAATKGRAADARPKPPVVAETTKPTRPPMQVADESVKQENPSVLCKKLESSLPPVDLASRMIEFPGPKDNAHKGANGFLTDAPTGWDKSGTVWSCEFTRDGNARGVVYIHPLQGGQVVVTVTARRVHVGSPKQWPTKYTYDPRYFWGEFRPTPAPAFNQFFPLGDKPHQFTSRLAADGTYNLLIDGKVAYAGNVTKVFPINLTSEIKDAQGKPLAKLAAGAGGILIGPAENGSAKATQIQFAAIGNGNSVTKTNRNDPAKNGPPTAAGKFEPVWQHTARGLTAGRTSDWQKGIVYSLDVSPDSRRLLAASTAGFARLLDAKTGKQLRDFRDQPRGVSSVAFSPDGKRALMGSWDNLMRLWDVETGKKLETFVDHEWPVLTVAFSPDGKRALSGSDGLRLWELDSGKLLRRFPKLDPRNPIWSAQFTPDGKRIVGGCGNGTVAIWDLESDDPPTKLDTEAGRIKAIDVSADGRFAITAAGDRPIVLLYDLNSGKQIRQIEGHASGVAAVAISPNGKQIITGAGELKPGGGDFIDADDRSLRLWETATGRESLKIYDHPSYISSVAFSPDGRRVFTGSGDGIVRAWDLKPLGKASAVSQTDSSPRPSRHITNGNEKSKPGKSATAESKAIAAEQRVVAAIKKLKGTIRRDSTITYGSAWNVDLTGTAVTDDDLAILKPLQNLQVLTLDRTKVTAAGLVHLTEFTELRALSLSRTAIGEAGLVHLQELKQLEYLRLMGTAVTDAGLSNLKGLTKMKTLFIEGPKISDAGLANLQGFTELDSLRLLAPNVSDAGLVHLKGCTKLRVLNLYGAKVTGSGLAHLQDLDGLIVLGLQNTKVTDEELIHLQPLTSLKVLGLDRTNVTDAGLLHLHGIDTLKSLSLSNTKVTAAGVQRLKTAIPQCKIIGEVATGS